jgi:hypothetical protein
MVANVSGHTPRIHSARNLIITIFECEFTYIPPLKKFIDIWDHPITVANEENNCPK